MVLLNIKLDNILLFRNFELNLSYPKKIVGSTIKEEHLPLRPNFRFRKLVVLMGANATGKTALGKALMMIFNFISKKEAGFLFSLIDNHLSPASFSIDLAFPDHYLYRVCAKIKEKKNINDEYSGNDLSVEIKKTYIRTNDRYETCDKRLSASSPIASDYYAEAFEAVPPLTWLFEFPVASEGNQRAFHPADPHVYTATLKRVLKALDPRITDVKEIKPAKDTYLIIYPNTSILIENGLINHPEIMSSGTREGIGVAHLITSLLLHANDFFYCDEKFSHIHSDMEKAFLSLMVELLAQDQQLFFTTHNTDILDMNLPNHSFAFLRREENGDHSISCVYASDHLKKETISLRNAVENDLFFSSPDAGEVLRLAETLRGA